MLFLKKCNSIGGKIKVVTSWHALTQSQSSISPNEVTSSNRQNHWSWVVKSTSYVRTGLFPIRYCLFCLVFTIFKPVSYSFHYFMINVILLSWTFPSIKPSSPSCQNSALTCIFNRGQQSLKNCWEFSYT